jgi:hypothetical protein
MQPAYAYATRANQFVNLIIWIRLLGEGMCARQLPALTSVSMVYANADIHRNANREVGIAVLLIETETK